MSSHQNFNVVAEVAAPHGHGGNTKSRTATNHINEPTTGNVIADPTMAYNSEVSNSLRASSSMIMPVTEGQDTNPQLQSRRAPESPHNLSRA